MLKVFDQFVPSSVCLACDGCCRFSDAKSSWRPRVGDGEALPVIADREPIKSRRLIEPDRYLAMQESGTMFNCICLQSQGNKCRAYATRPFECQLYPFLIFRDGEAIVVAAHLNCPFIQERKDEKKFASYVSFLEDFFHRKEILVFLERNRALFPEYQTARDEVLPLFSL